MNKWLKLHEKLDVALNSMTSEKWNIWHEKFIKKQLNHNNMENGKQPIYPDPMRGAEQSFTNQSPHDLAMGLTKREYFAGLAMQGIMASLTEMRVSGNSTLHFHDADKDVAREAVSIADAVLAELDKPKND